MNFSSSVQHTVTVHGPGVQSATVSQTQVQPPQSSAPVIPPNSFAALSMMVSPPPAAQAVAAVAAAAAAAASQPQVSDGVVGRCIDRQKMTLATYIVSNCMQPKLIIFRHPWV